jgi:hypothetical protein
MGIRLSKRPAKITVTLAWNYTDLDQIIIKDVKYAFVKFGYCNIKQDTSDHYKNRVSGQIRLNQYNHNHKNRLESIPQDHGVIDAILYVVNPETDVY